MNRIEPVSKSDVAYTSYDNQDAVSFGIGKRFQVIGDALWHGSYTQNGSKDAFTIGAVFRF